MFLLQSMVWAYHVPSEVRPMYVPAVQIVCGRVVGTGSALSRVTVEASGWGVAVLWSVCTWVEVVRQRPLLDGGRSCHTVPNGTARRTVTVRYLAVGD